MRTLSFLLLALFLSACAGKIKTKTAELRPTREILQVKVTKTLERKKAKALRYDLKEGIKLQLVGEIEQGKVFKSIDDPILARGHLFNEAYLVVDEKSKLTGYFIPSRKGFIKNPIYVRLQYKKLSKFVESPELAEPREVPKLKNGKARIYLYRDNGFVGGGLKPDIRLGGKLIGEAAKGSYFYQDIEPGHHEIETKTEATMGTEFVIAAGEIKVFKMKVGTGFFVGRIYPHLVNVHNGLKELAEMHYVNMDKYVVRRTKEVADKEAKKSAKKK